MKMVIFISIISPKTSVGFTFKGKVIFVIFPLILLMKQVTNNKSKGENTMYKKIISIVTVLAMLLSFGAMAAPVDYGEELENAPKDEYYFELKDVPKQHWAHKYINEMVDRGVITGYPNGYYYPENNVTRGEFAKIMMLASGLEMSSDGTQTFADVGTDTWYWPYVEAAKYYLSGYTINGQNYFMPDSNALREDIAVALVKLKGYDTAGYDLSILKAMFTDWESISSGARPYVAVAVERGLISGYEDGTFRGQAGVTRAETATLLWRAYQYGNDNKDFDVQTPSPTPVIPTPTPTPVQTPTPTPTPTPLVTPTPPVEVVTPTPATPIPTPATPSPTPTPTPIPTPTPRPWAVDTFEIVLDDTYDTIEISDIIEGSWVTVCAEKEDYYPTESKSNIVGDFKAWYKYNIDTKEYVKIASTDNFEYPTESKADVAEIQRFALLYDDGKFYLDVGHNVGQYGWSMDTQEYDVTDPNNFIKLNYGTYDEIAEAKDRMWSDGCHYSVDGHRYGEVQIIRDADYGNMYGTGEIDLDIHNDELVFVYSRDPYFYCIHEIKEQIPNDYWGREEVVRRDYVRFNTNGDSEILIEDIDNSIQAKDFKGLNFPEGSPHASHNYSEPDWNSAYGVIILDDERIIESNGTTNTFRMFYKQN